MPGNKNAICAGVEVGASALQRIGHGCRGLCTGLPESVRSGVDHQMNSKFLTGCPRNLDALNLVRNTE